MARKASPKPPSPVDPLTLEEVDLSQLKPHPQNYRAHPEDQLAHLQQSLQDFGIYKNIVVARDNTILAGHGLVESARQLGMQSLPVRRLDLDPQEEDAIRILVGDNEVARLALMHDRQLTDLLKGLQETQAGLLGTGFDPDMLAALVYVTRPESEILDKNMAAQWIGLPAYENPAVSFKLILHFRTLTERQAFLKQLAMDNPQQEEQTITRWYPARSKEDLAALRFEAPTL